MSAPAPPPAAFHRTGPLPVDEVAARLEAFLDSQVGEASVERCEAADGHGGQTYLVRARLPAQTKELVLKLAPIGVRRDGATDIARQAPLLRALARAGVAAPRALWALNDPCWFGAPFLVMDRLPGQPFQYWDPHPSFDRTPETTHRAWLAAAQVLPTIHRLDWRAELAGWEAPQSLRQQIERWRPVYLKAPEAAWARAAERLEARLLDTLGDAGPTGLFHGDFQTANLLYAGDAVTGVIDWDLAGIGSQLLDIGWLLMISDCTGWPDAPRPPPAEALQAAYESGMGRRFEAIPWFRALAGYRLGAIACLNVRLHRSGRRPDSTWERIAPHVPEYFNNAEQALAAYAR